MFPIVPHRFRYGGRTLARTITLHDLLKAYHGAAAIAGEIRERQGAYWQNEAWGVLLSAPVPLAGYLLLHWQLSVIVLSIAIHNMAVWVADAVERLRAPYAVETEEQTVGDAEMSAQVAWAMLHAGRARRSTPDSPDRPVLALSVADFGARWAFPNLVRYAGLWTLALALPLIGAVFAAKGQHADLDGVSLALLGLPCMIQLTRAWHDSSPSSGETQSRPQLYPRTPSSCAALLLAGVSYILLFRMGFALLHLGTPSTHFRAIVFLATYLAVSAGLGIGAMLRMYRAARLLSTFAARDIDALKAVLARCNPAQADRSG